MKKYSFLLIFIVLAAMAFCQPKKDITKKTKTYSENLLYSSSTMNKLAHIVDSLNLKYKTCDLNPSFYAKHQAIGHYIKLEKKDVKKAIEDMKAQMPLEDFLKKHPRTYVEDSLLVVKFNTTDYDDNPIILFSEIAINSNYGSRVKMPNQKQLNNESLNKKWVFQYYSKDDYDEESVKAFYFPNGFTTTQSIPQQYAKMIGYADCLIDTTTTKFKKEAEYGRLHRSAYNGKKLSTEEQLMLLDTLRSIKVIGGCSQDRSPRIHAQKIAVLSAETAQWEIFLKAHLDIMNDRFERVSDASSAWKRRKTYIRELEELDINVLDLILGISFRVENPAHNHYYGSIHRVGRALSETQNREKIETALLAVIKDQELDDYNRVLGYFIYLNYHYYLTDEAVKATSLEQFKKAITTLPNYIKNKIETPE